METTKPPTKMFLDIVGELKSLINEEQIKIGGKLPSERELAERLKAGRSTIREALRSLELLGLIETRRGEGTFLADYRKHQLVEVLADFILQRPESIRDVQDTRKIHEMAAIQSVCQKESLRRLPVWESLLSKIGTEGSVYREDIIREMIIATGNRLSLKVWFLLKQYGKVPFSKMTQMNENEMVSRLLQSVRVGDKKHAIAAYLEWIEVVETERGEFISDT